MIRRPSLLIALLLPVASSSTAQQTEPPATDAVGGYVAPEIRLTRLDGEAVFLVGGGAGLLLGSRVTLGGRGYVLPGTVQTARDETGTRHELGFGYGGVALEYLRARSDSWFFGVGMLIGAGRAELSNPDLRTEVANDNFVVLEPEVRGGVAGPAVLTTWVGVSYRAVLSVQDLPGLGSDRLRGLSVSLGIRFANLP